MVFQKESTVNFILVCCLVTVAFSCNGSKKKLPTVPVDLTLLPDMHTEDGLYLISDSGVTRYRIEAKVWDEYSRKEEPYAHFPVGFQLEGLDSLFNTQFFVRADTVYWYTKKGLWRAIGNVFIKNETGETVETEELFFNEKADPQSLEAVYTDKYVVINRGTTVATGYGLRANASLSDLRLYQSTQEFDVNLNNTQEPTDTLSGN
jgi:Protein of unknown function (DUF1239).